MSEPDKDRLAATWGDEIASVCVNHNDGQEAYFSLNTGLYISINTEYPESGVTQVSLVDNDGRSHKYTYFNVEQVHVIYAEE